MTVLKAGLYLRQGATVTPGILSFDNGVLTFKTTEKTVFELQANEAQVNFSTYGTVTITRGQESWVFVAGGYSGAFAPKFSAEQIKELTAGENSITLAAKTKGDAIIYRNHSSEGIEPVLNGGRGYGLVGLMLAELQRSAFYSNLALVEFLQANGLQVTIQSKKFSKSLWTIFIIVIVSVAILSTVMYLVLDQLLD